MKSKELNRKIYVVKYAPCETEDAKVEVYTIKEYIDEFLRDLTTTPKGVAPRLFVESIVNHGETIWIHSTWGAMGNSYKPYVEETFKTKEEAELALYAYWWRFHDGVDHAPSHFSTLKKARNFCKELNKPEEEEEYL